MGVLNLLGKSLFLSLLVPSFAFASDEQTIEKCTCTVKCKNGDSYSGTTECLREELHYEPDPAFPGRYNRTDQVIFSYYKYTPSLKKEWDGQFACYFLSSDGEIDSVDCNAVK